MEKAPLWRLPLLSRWLAPALLQHHQQIAARVGVGRRGEAEAARLAGLSILLALLFMVLAQAVSRRWAR